ncbi:MAG: hypothetical protein WAN47_10860 [Nitrosotalea sp.]
MRTHQPRYVQCPRPTCKRVFSSGVSEPMCSKCHQRFWADHNLFKTTEDRAKERLSIYELLRTYKKNQEQMNEEVRKKTVENEVILTKIEELLRPV